MFQQIVGADGDMTFTTIIYINMLQDRFALIKKKKSPNHFKDSEIAFHQFISSQLNLI